MYRAMEIDTRIWPGLEGRLERVVDETLVTRHVGGDGVFGTPYMILLMEHCAHDSVTPYLRENETTVGYEVSVRHLGMSVPGATVVVTSRLKEVNGAKLLFEVECRDGDRLVGTGTHKRAVVPVPESVR